MSILKSTDIDSIWYHCAIIELFRPCLKRRQQKVLKLKIFHAEDRTPEAISSASITQLKRLAIEYKQKYSKYHACASLNNGIIEVTNAVLNEHRDAEGKFYFLLCLCLVQDLYVCYPLYELEMQGFLAMAIKNEKISTSEATMLREKFYEKGKHHRTNQRNKSPDGSFAIDFELAIKSAKDGRVKELSKKLQELLDFEQFTNGEYVAAQDGS